MKDTKTISWIFLSIAISSSSENAPIDYNTIIQTADGINHAIPTDKELLFSIDWLIKNEMITKNSKLYSLTDKGRELYFNSKQSDCMIFKIWSNVEQNLKVNE